MLCFVKWSDENVRYDMFRVNFGVRQGSVLSPLLFALYLDDLAKSCDRARNVFIILYADDILLLATSVSELDNIFKICERELKLLDMAINVKKIILLLLLLLLLLYMQRLKKHYHKKVAGALYKQ